MSSFLEKLASCLFYGNQSSVNFVQHSEVGILTSVIQGSPVQAMEHVTCSVSVSVGDIACSTTLYHLKLLYVLGVCGSNTVLAYSTRGLTRVKYACCLMATALILRFGKKEAEGSVSFRTCIIDVSVPF